MERTKLKLKEQAPGPNTSMDWVQARYAQPKPPSALDRLRAVARQLGRLLILVVVAASVFLAIPVRRWDDYAVWRQICDALAHLESQPDSVSDLRTVSATAISAQILWDQPSGERPEWYRPVQLKRYDASFATIQTLALGLIKIGNVSRGLSELERLQQRTGLSSLPTLPDVGQAIRLCAKCDNGKVDQKCSACGGKGAVSVSQTNASFPLQAKLGGTQPASRKLGDGPAIRHDCPACNKTGALLMPCQTCSGQGRIIIAEAVPDLFKHTVRDAITVINSGMALRRALHFFANGQRALLLKSGEVGKSVLSVAQVDAFFASTNAAPSLLQRSRTTDFGDNESEAGHSGGDAGQGATALNPEEARLQKACETLQHSPLSTPDLQILADVSRFATNNPALRSRAMAAFSLSLLLRSNTNAFARVAQIQKTTFPDQPPFLSITKEDYIATCGVCLGTGMNETPCPSCMGPHKCETCNGLGKTRAGEDFVRCESCWRRGICKMCKGQRRMSVACYTCKGAGKSFALTDNVRNNYNALLADIVAICRENAEFAARLDTAKREPDSMAQTHLLQAVTNRFHHRADLAQATALLDGVHREQALRVNARGGAEPQNRSLREASSRSKGQAAVRPYLVAIVGVFLISLLIRFLLTRKRAQVFRTLPGMGNIDKEEFADPLTLTALESRRRVKSETARIPLPEHSRDITR